MESLDSHQIGNEFNKDNDEEIGEVDGLCPSSALTCNSLKNISHCKEVLSVDQRNGNIDAHFKLQNEEKILEGSEKLPAVENLPTGCDNKNLNQDINSENVNSITSTSEIGANSKILLTDDLSYFGKNNENENIEENIAKDKCSSINGKRTNEDKTIFDLNVTTEPDTNNKNYPLANISCTSENNVNTSKESPFEDSKKCSVDEDENNKNSLLDPLLLSSECHNETSNEKENKEVTNNSDTTKPEDKPLPKEISINDKNCQENLENELAIPEALFINESQDHDSVVHDTQKELEAILAPQSNNIVEGFGEDSILIANLSVPPPIQLVREIEVTPPEEDNLLSTNDLIDPIIKKPRLDDGEIQNYPQPLEGNEGKPSLLKILPIKNGHGLWNMEGLKMLLEERGSILLRLCGAPEAGNEDIIDGPKADFTALLLDDSAPIPDGNCIIEPEKDFSFSQNSLIDGLSDSFLNEEYTPPFWKHRVADSRIPSIAKKKRLPPSSRSFAPKIYSTPGQPRGRKRGRPPLHNRGWIPKIKFSPPKFLDEPIKFRPPTPPSTLVGDGSRSSVGLLEAALSKNSPLVFGKKSCFDNTDNNLQEQNRETSKSFKGNKEQKVSSVAVEEEEEQMSAGTNVSEDTDQELKSVSTIQHPSLKPKKLMIRIPCPHCPLTFRKKLALTGHIKLRHKTLKKCPICFESIRIKGKFTMQLHLSKVHKDDKNFECDICQMKFKLYHHLKNHKRLIHDIVSSSADNSEDEDTSTFPSDTLGDSKVIEKQKIENEKEDSHSDSENEIKEESVVRSTRITRSGTVYEMKTNAVREEKTSIQNKKSPTSLLNSMSKTKNNPSSEGCQGKFLILKENYSNPIVRLEDSMLRTLRSRSTATKYSSKGKESLKTNEEKKKIGRIFIHDKKTDQSIHDVEDEDEGEGLTESETGNQSDDEDESESDSEVEEKKKYFCDKCEMGFSHVFKLRHHKKKKHSSSQLKSESKGSGSKNESFTCKICQKKCRSEQQLKDHAVQHKALGNKTKLTSVNIQTGSSDRKPITSIRSSTESFDSQPKGEESETEEPSATEGILIKSGEIPPYIVRRGRIYFCTKCDLSFKRERQMTYHLKKIHEALYPFRKCPDCPRVFRSSGPFTRHLREHRGKRCPVDGCKAKYKVLRMIKKHQRHAHPKLPHRCTRCVALFAKELELEQHTKNEHKDSDRRKSKDGDDEDDDDDDDDEMDEEDEDFEEEEEEDEEDEEEEEEPKVQINNRNKNKQEKSNNSLKKNSIDDSKAKNDSTVEGTTPGVRRSRSANVSYKEDDDDDEDDFTFPKIVGDSQVKTTNLTLIQPFAPFKETTTTQQTEDTRKPSFPSHCNPLKNLREAIMMQKNSKPKPQPVPTESLPPYIKPKRPYVRRAPYKKRKTDNSWTAAVKAQYQGFPSSDSSDTTFVSPSTQLNAEPMLNPSPVYSSPGITADVVRRVAESLLNRHQEQQQQQQQQQQTQIQLQRQEKAIKPQKRPYRRRKPCSSVNPSFISYNSKSSQLPRIAYSSLVAASASRENSMSSFEDSSHAPELTEYYGTSFPSAGRYFPARHPHHPHARIPDDEDSGPPKVLRFDSF